MGRREPSIFEILMDRPWWVSAAVALFVYVTMAIFLPGIAFDNIVFRAIVSSMPQAAPYVASLFLIPIPFSIFNLLRKRQLVDSQAGIQSIRALSWKQLHNVNSTVSMLGEGIKERQPSG